MHYYPFKGLIEKIFSILFKIFLVYCGICLMISIVGKTTINCTLHVIFYAWNKRNGAYDYISFGNDSFTRENFKIDITVAS